MAKSIECKHINPRRSLFVDIKIYEKLLRNTHYLSNEYFKLQLDLLELYHKQNKLAKKGKGYIKFIIPSKTLK